MPRRKCRRRIGYNPCCVYFKPRGEGLSNLEEIILFSDKLEAIRLKDYEGLDQNNCAEKMNISQPTLHRILLSARRKVSDALVNGKAIRVEKQIA
jgi:uncharacterized protein